MVTVSIVDVGAIIMLPVLVAVVVDVHRTSCSQRKSREQGEEIWAKM